MFFRKEPNHGYLLFTHNHNLKNYTLHLQLFKSMWSITLFDNNMILVYFRCNNSNIVTIYGT
jgi:hypothetical protein